MESNGKMKAQLFYGPGNVRYKETDIPRIGPGEALACAMVAGE